jgi:hypothetical protein
MGEFAVKENNKLSNVPAIGNMKEYMVENMLIMIMINI